MNEYLEYLVLLGVVAGVAFVILRPRYKVFIAFFIMTYCFNMLPRAIMRIELWDIGAVLLLISGIQLLFMKTKVEMPKANYLIVLKLFYIWVCVCFLWSFLVYDYPLIETIKSSRQMIIGYLFVFIFIRFFRVDPDAVNFFLKMFYWSTFVLMVVCVAQYLSHTEILFIRETKYAGTFRLIPTFIPISLLFLWIITSKLIGRAEVKWHEVFYIILVMAIVGITFTRGIYLTVMAIFLLMLLIMLISRKLVFNRLFVFSFCLLLLFSILGMGGALDKVVDRAASGLMLITGAGARTEKKSKDNYDTFTGRILTTKERFELVYEKNPLIGFGFIHEDRVPSSVRNKLKHGSVIDTEKYKKLYATRATYTLALFSADIGWANIILFTGYVGFLLLICFIVCFAGDFIKNINLKGEKYYFVRLGTYLQILAMVLLMFNGTPLNALIQIPAFMIAGYAINTALAQKNALES